MIFQVGKGLLFWLTIYPMSFFGFGWPFALGSHKAWIKLSRDEQGIKELYGVNKWIHVCFGYRKSDGFIIAIRVNDHTEQQMQGIFY